MGKGRGAALDPKEFLGQTQEHWDPLEHCSVHNWSQIRTVMDTGIIPVPGTFLRREDELQLKWDERNSVKAENSKL